ncbi:PadR family transcriptional regulator [Bacillaceae bacterium SIJ1]|uniref:PadR family transcriptional regulator n=1 Tax=Litoribacterium kuwaitense TaxID=1398745 RepID=UPI0013EAD9C3|nr:helix-turn-helix transcriptional regulator [Litoribacterium kuwaitense]NGP43882.1 PadR family transcriptional regulator [Litoribacterium kuwaitense]
MNKEVVRGSIDLLILSSVKRKDRYGYEIVQYLRKVSEGVFEMKEGTLYPALKRLEKKEWVRSYWTDGDFGRRKYYSLTGKGKTALEERHEEWTRLNDMVVKMIEESGSVIHEK